ncbi:MAG: hormogonium polysaccharide biosynthesis protein HpsA [Oculatellaceae cyanobacterium bins.114]|nr:hormogonium polysaccharide biosynthesis protein HpsA [Oculatellaceae cyanobacterium bins.114]
MSTRKLTRAVQELIQQINKTSKSLSKGVVLWLLRNLLVIGRQPLLAKSGFVLPTTVLLLLVLTLTVGSIGYRTYTRSVQAVGDRQQQVIYNAATPAIDRAKSKLEYLFDAQKDTRFPGGVPSEGQLLGMLYNDGRTVQPGNVVVPVYQPDGYDPYTFLDEQRISANGDATIDNAWRFRTDTNGDGTVDSTVVYSIVFRTPPTLAEIERASDADILARANNLMVRHGPLSNSGQANAACQLQSNQAAPPVEQGWFRDNSNTSLLRKNFQVNAFVLPDNANGTASTLEFHQDRQVTRGNKWGAWFRNDLEIFPGPVFNWNGAMHTEGNLVASASSGFTGFMISAPTSCLYTKDASEITVTNISADPANEIPAFQGQFLSGNIKNNQFVNEPVSFHLFDGLGRNPIRTGAPVDFRSTTDSVVNSGLPADYALDPVRLQTEDVSVARNIADPAANREAAWDDRDFVKKERLINRQQPAPYVDDSYRADNRYGPKPRYKGDPIPGRIGEEIAGDPELIGNDPQPGQDDTSIGLDGYWERRARREGMRVIVGQRLELGDPMGWGGFRQTTSLAREPLRPWQRCTANNAGICNEARQRRTLWDNLAAVQSAAIYHSASGVDTRDFPVACLALTTHPGTSTTLAASATFENLIYPGQAVPAYQIPGYAGVPIQHDFFRGRGTNGWEFAPPVESAFRNPSSPLMLALQNLATFAGDPQGGAPSFTPVQDRNVHPYPSMSMWGDFSMLRRVLQLVQANGYDGLSPADKTVLHTAGCTMGMLAYNIDYLENFDPLDPASGVSVELLGIADAPIANLANYYKGLRGKLRQLRDGVQYDSSNDPPAAFFTGIKNDITNIGYSDRTLIDNPEVYVRFLEQWRDWMVQNAKPFNKIDEMNAQIYLAQLLITKEQVARDRLYGFYGSGSSATAPAYGKAPLGRCLSYFGGVPLPGGGSTPARTYAQEPFQLLCSARPRYPILYSLFPAKDDLVPLATDNPVTDFTPNYAAFEAHPEEIEVSRDSEDSTDTYITLTNSGSLYRIVDPEFARILPRQRGSWVLANEVVASTFDNPTNNRDTLIKICTTPCLRNTSGSAQAARPVAYQGTSAAFVRIPFKDSALYNQRELMSVRTLDMNLDLMRRVAYNGDFWLPRSGIIYAFREDATSEVEVIRPTTGAWSTCRNNTTLQTNASCRMNTGTPRANASTDPPISTDNAISPKPVDYYADPDRRPNGFRVRRGTRLGRTGDQGRGLSLISDNPVYIQGSFNLHQTPGGNRLEEFTQLLADDFSNFYGRTNLDGSFSRPASDDWRPAEILADAITIISDNFCDGSIEDGVLTAGNAGPNLTPQQMADYGCTSSHSRTSYLNQDRPSSNPAATTTGVRWLRTNIADSMSVDPSIPARSEGTSPIVFTRDNNPMQMTGPTTASDYAQGFYTVASSKPLMPGLADTRINAIIISGLVPSRPLQSYGGLHNFPRFIESWSGQSLFISGSFLQLNFSTHATAPFDQDSFEVGSPAQPAEVIPYYGAPNRRWGYDVGLQYAPAGPIASRFVTSKAVRDEFYTEPPANDPYIRNLCLAAGGSCPL